MQIYTVLWDHSCEPCWPPDQEIRRLPLGDSCKHWSSRCLCKLFLERYWPRECATMVSLSSRSWRPSLTSRAVRRLNPCSFVWRYRIKTIGLCQAKSGVVFQYAVCAVPCGGWPACQDSPSDCYNLLELRNSSPLGHRARRTVASPVCFVWTSRLQ